MKDGKTRRKAPSLFLKALGNAVRARRKKLLYLQKHFAKRANLQTSYLCEIERGMRNPTIGVIYSIAISLNLLPHQLMEMAEIEFLKFTEGGGNDSETDN